MKANLRVQGAMELLRGSEVPSRSWLVASAFLVLLMAGCSSTPTHVDRGDIKARTFSFVRLERKPPDFVENGQDIHAMVQEAITRGLASKGVTRVPSAGDVTVAYLIIIGNSVTTRAVSDYFGYSEDAVALAEKAHAAQTDNNRRGYFEDGTLLIDIDDPKTQKVLWRNYAVRPIQRGASPSARQERIQQAVNEILGAARINTQ